MVNTQQDSETHDAAFPMLLVCYSSMGQARLVWMFPAWTSSLLSFLKTASHRDRWSLGTLAEVTGHH